MSDTYTVADDGPTYSDLRVLEATTARRAGAHYWLATTMHKVKGPELGTEEDPLILDQENYRGTLISCAICGAGTNDEPCPGI